MDSQGNRQVFKQNEGTPTFSIGYHELIISPIVCNGDFHGLWQFGLLEVTWCKQIITSR